MDLLGQLQSHPLFATFTPDALAEVVRQGTAATYEAGETCIHHDEAGEVFGVLISGRLEAVRDYGSPAAARLGYVEPGECFGEMSMLTGNPTSADVVAAEKSEVVVFFQEAISTLLATNADAVKFLARLIAKRLSPKPEQQRTAPKAVGRYALGAVSPMRILSVSCRQDSVRYAYFDTTSEASLAWGRITGLGNHEAAHVHKTAQGERTAAVTPATHKAALRAALAALTAPGSGLIASPADLSAIAHRVCHGGTRFNGPTIVDDNVKAEIKRLSALMPFDNPYNLAGIEACQKLAPGIPQVAVFDTAFHLTMPEAASRYALPADLAQDKELRRYGFHGISHEGAGRAAAAHLGINFDALRIITVHLGAGASITAIDHGRSVDNTMGFTPLEGLVMATRPGDIDPGLILHLVRERRISPDELYRRLFTESGLLGLSGVSGDVLEVMEAANRGEPRAILALQVFCQRAKKHLSAFVGLLGGVDAIVFTGGVGENSPGVRARILQGLDWMGIALDEDLNRNRQAGRGQPAKISAAHSRTHILVVRGDEEQTIARHAVQALSHARVTQVMRQHELAIPIGISAHHLHLTPEHVEALFGKGHTLTWFADLTQPGQYACQEKVNLIGPKGRIDNVRVLGPVRPESQVEIARTEEFKLGIDAPIRHSGDLDGTPGIQLEGPNGCVRLDHGVICAMRHIHMSPEDAMAFAVRDRDVVRIRVPGERSLIFGDVVVRVHPDFRLDMHIDTDEANAAELGAKAVGYLDSIQHRAAS
ncbi:MAG: acetate/propionate family kinase [Planctomycetota bacterium]|nr:acetate/propionate family kinase [Planctomycetota bacterium]